jgi:hypothetical protein
VSGHELPALRGLLANSFAADGIPAEHLASSAARSTASSECSVQLRPGDRIGGRGSRLQQCSILRRWGLEAVPVAIDDSGIC